MVYRHARDQKQIEENKLELGLIRKKYPMNLFLIVAYNKNISIN